MADPPPIPTWHDGILYRSRLEARWRIFFDELGLDPEYETQGFDVDGTWYLPDFLLHAPLGDIWAEVKPTWSKDPAGVAKWRKFTHQRPQPSRAILLTGVPSARCRPLVTGGDDDDPDTAGAWEDDTQEWRPCPDGKHFDLVWPGRFRSKFAEDGCPQNSGGDGEQKIADACAKALSARFSNRTPEPTGPGR